MTVLKLTKFQVNTMTVAQLRTASLRAGTAKHKLWELWALCPQGTEAQHLAWETYRAAAKTHDHLMALWTAADRKKENRK